jgi:mono/diheme cytochrome c family protein
MKRVRPIALAALVLAAVLLAAAVLAAWPRAEHIPSRSPQAWAATPANIARGAYLARAGDCAACHTARGGAAYAGGRALETPFGKVFAPNITPDAETGIGNWSADDFWNALHNGIGRGGRLLYPAFPYPNYSKVTRDDADALFAGCAACRRRASPGARMNCASPTTARRHWRPGACSTSVRACMKRSRRAGPPGTAAPTWSRAWATAAPATARATAWAPAARACTAA